VLSPAGEKTPDWVGISRCLGQKEEEEDALRRKWSIEMPSICTNLWDYARLVSPSPTSQVATHFHHEQQIIITVISTGGLEWNSSCDFTGALILRNTTVNFIWIYTATVQQPERIDFCQRQYLSFSHVKYRWYAGKRAPL
jgi:hypothetical protein